MRLRKHANRILRFVFCPRRRATLRRTLPNSMQHSRSGAAALRIFPFLSARRTCGTFFWRKISSTWAAETQKACWPFGVNGRCRRFCGRRGIPALFWRESARGDLLVRCGCHRFVDGHLAPLPCLGWLPGACCPHYHGEVERRPSVHKFVAKGNVPQTLALDDGAAAHFVGRKLKRIVCSRPDAKAFWCDAWGKNAVETALPVTRLK